MGKYINIKNKLSSAIKNGEFKVCFQPIYDIKKQKIIGVEALSRWNLKEEIISPDEYIPEAKRTSVIVELDNFVLKEACRCCREMNEIGVDDFKIFLNISYSALRKENFIKNLVNIIKEEKINSSSINLEITEDEIIDDVDFIVNILNKLKKLDFNIALDDFGVGYSALNYIKILPLDILKIDRSLLENLEKDKKTFLIIEYIINLSHELGIEVVCEGVETFAQLDILKNINCDKIQGFYISKPIEFDIFKNFIIDFNKIERSGEDENNKEGWKNRGV